MTGVAVTMAIGCLWVVHWVLVIDHAAMRPAQIAILIASRWALLVTLFGAGVRLYSVHLIITGGVAIAAAIMFMAVQPRPDHMEDC